MQIRTMAAVGVSLWLAAAATASLAAEKAQPDAKPAREAGETKNGKDAKAGGNGAVKSAGPRLRMAEPEGGNPGKDRDLRHCLDLPTPKEVIRCSEAK